MKAKVIKTTDKKYLGQVFLVDSIDMTKINEATGNKFNFDEIKVKGSTIVLKNSNYTAILKII